MEGGDKVSIILGTIAGLRRSRKLTQKQVCKELGISYQAYSNKENGKVDFTANEIGTLANLFNVSPAKFYEEL